MFWGEFLCLIIYYGNKWFTEWKTGKKSSELAMLLPKIQADSEQKMKPPLWTYAVLSVFDCTATTLTSIGTLYISASLTQMLRGSMILFTAVFSLLLLKKKHTNDQFISLGVVVVALFVVGLSGYYVVTDNCTSTTTTTSTTNSFTVTTTTPPTDDDDDGGCNEISNFEVILGILLVVAGSAFNAFQNVCEEKLLKGISYADVDSLEVVGWEGLFGSIISMFVMLPIAQNIGGPLKEDTWDTIDMLHNSWKPGMFFAFGFAFCLTGLNYYSQQLSKYINAVVRMLVSTVRVVLVWIISLIIYYGIDKDLGEGWQEFSSSMQLGGFILLVVGTLMYMRAKDIPIS